MKGTAGYCAPSRCAAEIALESALVRQRGPTPTADPFCRFAVAHQPDCAQRGTAAGQAVAKVPIVPTGRIASLAHMNVGSPARGLLRAGLNRQVDRGGRPCDADRKRVAAFVSRFALAFTFDGPTSVG
jgi:hypothetical protein